MLSESKDVVKAKIVKNVEQRNALVLANLGIARQMAFKFEHFTKSNYDPSFMDIEDLFQEGAVGLIKASNKYKKEKSTFRTYGEYRARGAIQDALRTRGRIKISYTLRKDIVDLQAMTFKLKTILDREPTETELLQELKWSEQRFNKVKAVANIMTYSIQEPIPGHNKGNGQSDELRWENLLIDKQYIERQRFKKLQQLIENLLFQSRVSKKAFYAFTEFFWNGRKLKSIGDNLSVGNSMTCIYKTRAIKKLAEPKNKKIIQEFLADHPL